MPAPLQQQRRQLLLQRAAAAAAPGVALPRRRRRHGPAPRTCLAPSSTRRHMHPAQGNAPRQLPPARRPRPTGPAPPQGLGSTAGQARPARRGRSAGATGSHAKAAAATAASQAQHTPLASGQASTGRRRRRQPLPQAPNSSVSHRAPREAAPVAAECQAVGAASSGTHKRHTCSCGAAPATAARRLAWYCRCAAAAFEQLGAVLRHLAGGASAQLVQRVVTPHA